MGGTVGVEALLEGGRGATHGLVPPKKPTARRKWEVLSATEGEGGHGRGEGVCGRRGDTKRQNTSLQTRGRRQGGHKNTP